MNTTPTILLVIGATAIITTIIYKLMNPTSLAIRAAKDDTPLIDKVRDMLSMRQIDEGAFLSVINDHYTKKYGEFDENSLVGWMYWERLEDIPEVILTKWYKAYKHGGGITRDLVSRMKKEGVEKVVHEEMPIVTHTMIEKDAKK